MFWKLFFAMLAALLAFWVIAWLLFGVTLWGMASAADEDVKRTIAEQARRQHELQVRLELQEHQSKLRRAVCRDGRYYVPRRVGSVTYFDPLEWRGALVTCP